MSQFVRTAIVGMGIGRRQAKGIANYPRGRVVALCDVAEHRMQEFARELPEPVKMYTDYRDVLRDKEVDAVYIATPNSLHVPMGLDAIRAGKHVLMTKPLGHDIEAAAELIKTAESSGLVNMMSLSERFSPECLHLLNLAKKNYFGDLYYARARSVRRSGIPCWNVAFIQKGGGAFRDMGVHCLDAAWALLGFPKPLSVTGVAGARFGPRGHGFWDFQRCDESYYSHFACDDHASGLIRFENDVALHVESFWASHQPEEFQIELFGTEAGARLSPLTLYRTEQGLPTDTTLKIPQKPHAAWDNIAAHFIECVLDNVPCQAPLRHGYQIQQMMEALLQSAETGREIRLS